MSDENLTAVVHQSQVTKALRNILMNEMGLTLDYIRSTASLVVEQAVEKHVANMLQQNQIEALVKKHLNACMTRGDLYSTHRDKLTELVTAAIKDEAVRVLKDRVKIDIRPFSAPESRNG